jgi:hypothetical protein
VARVRDTFVAGSLVLIAAAACATSSEPAKVNIRNDLTGPVTLAVCGSHDCSKRLDPWLLQPGQTGSVGVEVNGGYGPAIVLRPDGTPLGCLPFQFSKRPASGFSVLASQVVPCGGSGGATAADGKDWPDPQL